MAEQISMSDAVSKMAERIAESGLGTQPEFEERSQAEPQPPAPEPGEPEQPPESEAAQEQAQETPEGEEEQEQYQLPEMLNDVAADYGISVDDLYGRKLSIKLDNATAREMSIEELKDFVQDKLQNEVDETQWRKAKQQNDIELEQQRQALEQRRAETQHIANAVRAQFIQQENQAAQQYNALLQNGEFQARDPQAYSVELMRAKAVYDQAQSQRVNVEQQATALHQSVKDEQLKQIQDAQARGRARLREWIPEWSTDEGWSEGSGRLETYIKQDRFGLDPQDIATASSPALFYWAEMARRYEELQKVADSPPKPSPRPTLAPGAPRAPLPRGRREELEAMGRLQKSGDIRDANVAMRARLRQAQNM